MERLKTIIIRFKDGSEGKTRMTITVDGKEDYVSDTELFNRIGNGYFDLEIIKTPVKAVITGSTTAT